MMIANLMVFVIVNVIVYIINCSFNCKKSYDFVLYSLKNL